MKRLLCFLIPLLLAVPAFAGSVYVPYANDVVLGGVTYETQVWLTNRDTANDQTIEYLHIPTFRDGTEREEVEPIEMVLDRGDTVVLAAGEGQGMIEFFLPQEVHVDARMVATDGDPEGQGFTVPVVSSDNVVSAGGQAHVLGWERRGNGATAFTNFGLLNLGHEVANCLVDVIRINGTTAVNDFPIVINPLSHNRWQQALGIVGVSEAAGWRSLVTCDQPFYSYSSINYPLTSRMAFVGPSASGRSMLERPTDGGVSSDFDYLSDLPIDRHGGLRIGPFIDGSGIEFHPSNGGPPIGPIGPIRIAGVTYEKGVAFYPEWSGTPFIEYKLDGQYALFTAVVRLDDVYYGRYEWAIVDPNNGNFIRLERPSDGARGRERTNPIRVGGAMTIQIIGDGELLYQTPEVYAYGDPVVVEVNVEGVDVLRVRGSKTGTEQLNAPHRNGLSTPRLVRDCPWLDMADLADAKLFYPN